MESGGTFWYSVLWFFCYTYIVKYSVRPGIPQWWSKGVVLWVVLESSISGTCKNCGGQILEDFSGYLPIEPPLTSMGSCPVYTAVLIIIFSTYQHHWGENVGGIKSKPKEGQSQQCPSLPTFLICQNFCTYQRRLNIKFEENHHSHSWDTSKQTFVFCLCFSALDVNCS